MAEDLRCFYNKEVERNNCYYPKQCKTCGWNPQVAEKRTEEIKRKELEKNGT